MRIKICGITRLEDALLCEKYGADSIGYIFYKASKRYIAPENAGKISIKLSPFISKVGVFVNESVDNINSISKIAGLNAVQLHGEETPEFIRKLNLPVIKAFRVK
ncbi:MAG: N-(5'-phosphoribosyl)anthranilate isomerase, partial [Oscillospiraceae bacterium]